MFYIWRSPCCKPCSRNETRLDNFSNGMRIAGQQHPVSVLAVDDEIQIQRLLTLALETEGYQVAVAGTAETALATAARHRHDLFLVDLGLPDSTGLLVVKRLREWTQAPILVLSVNDTDEEKIEALDGG